jgi:hypothetical protein
MKQILFFFLFCPFVFTVVSCDDQGELGMDESDKGFNLRVEPDKGTFDISVGDPEINFTMYSDTKTIDRVTILVELVQFGSDAPTRRSVLKEVPGNVFSNSSSSSVSIRLSEFANAVGLSVEELAGGDIFTIYNQVTMSDGRVYPDTLNLGGRDFLNVENSFFTAAGSTSFTGTLNFPVLCPFVASDAAGTYRITVEEAEVVFDPTYEPQVLAGPGVNQVTIKDLYSHPEAYDIVVDVNPVTDVATVRKQVAWNSDNFGFGLGEASIEGTGLYFSCTGFLTLNLTHSVSAGAFAGTYKLELTKKP